MVDGNLRPVAREHLLAEGIDFAEGSGVHPGRFEAEGKAAYA